MTRYVLIIFFLTNMLCSCREKETDQEMSQEKMHLYKPSFTSFEISYRGGWMGGLSFRVDSNKIFMAPSIWAQVLDSVAYGLLPDSICTFIDTAISRIRNDKSIVSNRNFCDDCDLVAIRAVAGNDSIKLFQIGEISDPIYRLHDKLDQFLKRKNYSYFHAYMILETAREIEPPMPPKIYK